MVELTGVWSRAVRGYRQFSSSLRRHGPGVCRSVSGPVVRKPGAAVPGNGVTEEEG